MAPLKPELLYICFYSVLQVCAVQVKYTGQLYACKKLDKRRLKQKGGERLALIEKQILQKADCRFVINLAYAYDDETHLCLVMDLMNGGDLKFHIYNLGKRGIRMDRVVYYVAQITTGILHLHAMDIVYRDMKPENVLVDAKGQCRLSDFGLAVELPKGKKICQKVSVEASTLLGLQSSLSNITFTTASVVHSTVLGIYTFFVCLIHMRGTISADFHFQREHFFKFFTLQANRWR